jgi:DNA-binding beta-propeller fold protein YncE
VHRPWARLPNGDAFGVVSQVAVLGDGRVVVAQRGDPAVLIFTPDGTLDTSWHHRKLGSVHGIAATPDGTLLFTSLDLHQVLRFDPQGRLLQELGAENHPCWGAPFNHPTDVAVDPRNGDLVVSDGYGNACIHRFDRDGRLLASWGEPGTGPGQFA